VEQKESSATRPGAQRKAFIEHARALRRNDFSSEAHGVMQRVHWSALKQHGYSATEHGMAAARAFECFRNQTNE
jgi:hypothetical protein